VESGGQRIATFGLPYSPIQANARFREVPMHAFSLTSTLLRRYRYRLAISRRFTFEFLLKNAYAAKT